MKTETTPENNLCGCGKEGRYMHGLPGNDAFSCNKYRRCPTYAELEQISIEQGRKIYRLQEAIKEVFITCNSTMRECNVKLVCKDLKSAQTLHGALLLFGDSK